MMIRHTLGYALTALMSCAATWLVASPGAATHGSVRAPAAATPTGNAAPMQADKGTLIAVASDGNVTLRVEQQPLEWVLEQIARQSGWSDVKERARGVLADGTAASNGSFAGAAPSVCAEAPMFKPGEAEQLLQAIQRGSEADRFGGLLQARADGVPVPDDTLKVLFETDASDQVRLLAFETYLEARSGDPATLRTALEAGLYVPSGAIQGEAKKRLEELREMARIDADSGQTSEARE